MPLLPEEIAKIQEEERILAEQRAKRDKVVRLRVALLLSAIPGLGQIYKGETRKGVLIFIFMLICQPLFGLYGLLITYVWQMFDAYGILSISKLNIKKLVPVLIYLIPILSIYSIVKGFIYSGNQPESEPVNVSVSAPAKFQTQSGANGVISNVNTASTSQQTLEISLKEIISRFEGGDTKVSFGELRILGSDEMDVPAGSNAVLVDVVLGNFPDRNSLIKSIANPLTFQLMEAAFADKNVNAYLVNVFYTVNIPSGNSKDTEIVNYSLLKSTYNDTKWTKSDIGDLCNLINEKDKELVQNNPDYLGSNGCYIDK